MKSRVKNVPWLLASLILIIVAASVSASTDLCSEPSCRCSPNEDSPDQVDVSCNCVDKQIINIGSAAGSAGSNGENGVTSKPKHNSVPLPATAAQLTLAGCHHVEIFSRALNHLPHLKKISITDSHKVVLHARLHEVRAGNGGTIDLQDVSLENIQDLKVTGQAFEGSSVNGVFTLKSVTIQKISPMSFNFDSVGEFNIINSKFERVPMWGFKLRKCGGLNILDRSHFASLASGALHVTCNRFMVAYSKFGALQDSSFNVRFGVADFQGNFFDTIVGKPFGAVQLLSPEELSKAGLDDSQVGLVFRENQFACNPALPVNALAFPAYDSAIQNPAHQVIVEENSFVCQCGRLDWLIGALNYNFDVENVSSLNFVRKIHDTAGKCLECGLTSCKATDRDFGDFSANVHLERTINGPLKCSPTKPKAPETTTTGKPEVQPPQDSKIVMAGGSNSISASSSASAMLSTLIMFTLMRFQG